MTENTEIEAIAYDEHGNGFEVTPEAGIENTRLCAKTTFDWQTGERAYYLKVTYNGHIYDPYAVIQSYSYRHARNWNLKRVSETVFGVYKKYLETHNKMYFATAERALYDQPSKR